MKIQDIFEEADESKKEAWKDATEKYHDKMSSKGKETRMFLSTGTHSKLKALKDKMKLDHVGQVVDALVRARK